MVMHPTRTDATVLVIDDEPEIRHVVHSALRSTVARVLDAADGRSALAAVKAQTPDLIVLDLGLPDQSGLDLCRAIRAHSLAPIVVLTARHIESDKVALLNAGADDYVTKPFSPRELIARIKALLRRAKEKDKLPDTLKIGDLAIDLSKIAVTVKGKTLELTAKEFELLKTLIKARGRVLTRDHLLDTIWGFDHAAEIQTRTVDVHIQTLRKKLKTEAKRIVTIKNYGYRFDDEG